MSLKGYGFCLLLAVIVGLGVLPAMAQENKELVTPQDPFILEPPTTSLPQAEKVDLSTMTPAPKMDRGMAGPSNDDGKTRIEQPVDDEDTQKHVKPERKTPKNVMRIDDKNKRRIQPVAVIKADLSPWGYTRRYLEGDISKPEHPYGSGTGPNAIGNNPNNRNIAAGFGGGRSRRDRRDDDDYGYDSNY